MDGRANSLVHRRGWLGLITLAVLAGCQSALPTAATDPVSHVLIPRVGLTLRQEYADAQPVLPPGVCPTEALTEEQAVAVALWNNARFIESLTDLGVAEGDLIQAGLLPNPEFVYFPPVDLRSFKYLFDLQLDFL